MNSTYVNLVLDRSKEDNNDGRKKRKKSEEKKVENLSIPADIHLVLVRMR